MGDQPTHPDVTVRLTGTDGNVFAVIAAVCRGLRRTHGQGVADDFAAAAMDADSYDDVLRLAMRTVVIE